MRIRMERPQREALPVIYDAIDSGEFPLIADTPLFEAPEKVSRRAKVRVYGDGRAIPVDA